MEADRAWLDAFRRGDRAALARVFDVYADDVASTLRAGVVVEGEGGRERKASGLQEPDVEQLVQETFLKAFEERARHSYDGVRPFGAWLATIARNLLIDRARAAARHPTAHGLDVERFAAAGPDPQSAAQERELVRLVDGFATGLGEPDKSIFRLRLVEGRGHKETGAAVGLSEMQVRRRDARIKQALLSFVQRHGFLPHAPSSIKSVLAPRQGADTPPGDVSDGGAA